MDTRFANHGSVDGVGEAKGLEGKVASLLAGDHHGAESGSLQTSKIGNVEEGQIYLLQEQKRQTAEVLAN